MGILLLVVVGVGFIVVVWMLFLIMGWWLVIYCVEEMFDMVVLVVGGV